MIERRPRSEVYYLFPGGQVEPGESLKETVFREVEEELGLRVTVGPLAAVVTFRGRQQYFFRADVLGGEFGSGQGPEMRDPAGAYVPVWLPVWQVLAKPLRPRVVAELVVAAASGRWPDTVIEVVDLGPLPRRFSA